MATSPFVDDALAQDDSRSPGLATLKMADSALEHPVKAMLLDKYFPVKSKTPDVIKVFQPNADLHRFAGKYQNDIYCHSCTPDSGAFRPQPFEVKVKNQNLEFWGVTWRKVSPLVFELATGPRAGQIKVAFREDSKGRITYMFQDWSTFERVP